MEPSQPVRPCQPTSKLVTLTVGLSNTRTDRGGRPRNRTETYTLGVLNGLGDNCFTPSYDLFSFCCYRALLLGSPGVIIRATIQPGGRKLLTEPLAPQRLRGEDILEAREWSNRFGLMFRLQTSCGKYTNRHFFGYRHSDRKESAPWLHYQPQEVILDSTTGAPPSFADVEDFQRKGPLLAQGEPLTKAQAWSTWFWLLLHTTFYAAKSPSEPGAADGQYYLVAWDHGNGIVYRGLTLMKAGC
jgi:hypothetical protein